MTTDLKSIIAREDAAVEVNRPVLEATIATALKRGAEGKRLFNDAERDILAQMFMQVRVAGELLGRVDVRHKLPEALLATKGDAELFFSKVGKALNAKPKEALQYFNALRPQGQTIDASKFLERHQRDAFKLVDITDKTVLDAVHQHIAETIATGEERQEAFADMLDTLKVTNKNPQYAEMVLRTNINDAYNAGQDNEVREDPEVLVYFPYWEYMNPDDDRTSDEHRANLTGGVDGTAFYSSDETFADVRGERLENCRCSFRWIDKYEAEEEGLPLEKE